MNDIRKRIAALKGWTQIDSPVEGEAVDPFWKYAYSGTIPNWPGDIAHAMTLADEFPAWQLSCTAAGYIFYGYEDGICYRGFGERKEDAICEGWLKWKEKPI